MARRTNYRNGDEISLSCGCDGCSPSRINGVLCHEHGCTDAWRDEIRECQNCGAHFLPEDRNQRFCDDQCAGMYFGTWDDAMEAEEADYEEDVAECCS
jgi:hypothetical protein